MKKRFLILPFALMTIQAFSQVGINTTDPKATLDIVGKSSETNVLDGVLVPRITAVQLKAKNYTVEQKGAILYVTENFINPSDAIGQTEMVKSIGLYEFDGIKWRRAGNSEETLYDVVQRGNYAGRFISFTGDIATKQGTRNGAIGINPATNSYFWGNMNPGQTGQNNIGIGLNALKNLTSGNGTVGIGNNAFQNSTGNIGTQEDEYNTGVGTNVGSLFKGDHNVALGLSALNSNWTGEQNTAVGQQAMAEGIGNEKVSYNTAIGSNALRLASQPFANIVIGRSAGVRMSGKNNIIIGNWSAASLYYSQAYNGNNKLLIHNQALDAAGNLINLPVGTNTLVYGDFEERWFRINGRFQVNPTYISNADNSYSKILLYNPSSGEVGTKDYLNIPTPPATGSYSLKAIAGNLQWIAE